MFTMSEMFSPSNRKFKDSNRQNVSTWNYYYTRMRNLCMTEYAWLGLPETCNERFLEKQLYYKPLAGFVDDPDFGWLSLPLNPVDEINIYDESVRYEAYGNEYHKIFDLSNLILIRPNLCSVPPDFIIRQFATRLANIERAIDTNINAQKTPILIMTEDKTRLTMQNIYQQYDGNSPVIYGEKKVFDPDAVKVLKTDAPFVADKLSDQRMIIWNEFLTFIGVNNVGTEKRERLTNDEVNANNEHIDMMAQVGLVCRQQAAKELSERLGRPVECRMRYSTIDSTPVENGEGAAADE